jgi:arsenate reductase-like glutaredoxin family protein
VLALVRAAGGVSKVLNTRHALVKENSWKENAPSLEEFVDAFAKEPNLLRRPVLLLPDEKVVVGFDEKAYARLAP